MTLQLYVLRQLLLGLMFAVGGMLFIALPGIAVNAIHRLGGVGFGILFGYLPLVLADLVPYLLPIGFLLALVSTYGRLAADSEWTAIEMAGISPLRMLFPGVVLALLLGGMTAYLERNVSPGLDLARREYLKSALTTTLRSLSPGRTQLRFGDFYMNSRFRQGNQFNDVLIHIPGKKRDKDRDKESGQTEPAPRDDEPDQTVLADRAVFHVDDQTVRVDLVNARRVHSTQDTTLGTVTLQRDLDTIFGTKDTRSKGWRYQTSGNLERRLRMDKIPEAERAAVRFEVHRRNALAATCVMFLLLGAPTGLFLRRGTQLGALATSVGYAFVYYLLSMRLGKALALNAAVPEWLAAWSTVLIGITAGLVLTWRIARR